MRKFVSLVLSAALLFLFSGIGTAADCNLAASKGGDKYHKPDCKNAQNIKAENKVCFTYPEDAAQEGYSACGVCKPGEHTKVVASKNSDKYHLSSCGLVKNIKPENLVTYDSPEDAALAGAVSPCGVCKPPKAPAKKSESKVNNKESIAPKAEIPEKQESSAMHKSK